MITTYKKDGSSISQLLQNNDINIQTLDAVTIIKISNGLQIVYGYTTIPNRTWERTAQLYYSSGYHLYPASHFVGKFICLVEKVDDAISWTFKANTIAGYGGQVQLSLMADADISDVKEFGFNYFAIGKWK